MLRLQMTALTESREKKIQMLKNLEISHLSQIFQKSIEIMEVLKSHAHGDIGVLG